MSTPNEPQADEVEKAAREWLGWSAETPTNRLFDCWLTIDGFVEFIREQRAEAFRKGAKAMLVQVQEYDATFPNLPIPEDKR